MGTLETIVLILSYVKHNPGCKFDDIFTFLCPSAEGPDYEDLKLELKSFIMGLELDNLIIIRNESGEFEHFIGPAIPSFAWGFRANNDEWETTHASGISVIQTYCHLGTKTEPVCQTQMQFTRQQAKQQLMQLIGALL